MLAAVVATGLPAVRVGTWKAEPAIGAVSIDGYAAALTMTAHIAALGHRRIGFIRGNPDQTASERRFLGYRDGLERAALAFDPGLVAPGLFTYRSGLEAAERLLTGPAPPTAIFASNDDMAAAATVAVALRRGLAVPEDLTVCGFDDTAIATTIWPELTTIRQPIREMSHTGDGPAHESSPRPSRRTGSGPRAYCPRPRAGPPLLGRAAALTGRLRGLASLHFGVRPSSRAGS